MIRSDYEEEYLVTWQINILATSPQEAARIAREIQLDPDSTATYFEVNGETYDSEMRTL